MTSGSTSTTCSSRGSLHSVPHDHADPLSKTWVGIGIRTAPIEDRSRRLGKLIESLQASIPAEDAKHTDWFHFAHGWAELVLLMNEQSDTVRGDVNEQSKSLQTQVDAGFTAWLLKRYAGLDQPAAGAAGHAASPPAVSCPPSGRRPQREDRTDCGGWPCHGPVAGGPWCARLKAARFPIPGAGCLCLDSFTHLRFAPGCLCRQGSHLFSRTASRPRTRNPRFGSQFWADHGFTPNEVVYIKGLGDGSLESVSEALSHPKARIAGLVVDKVDKIMHGMEMGTAGMHNQVGQWAKQPYLSDTPRSAIWIGDSVSI